MTITSVSMNGLPSHHEGMLVVKLRSSMARFAPSVAASSATPDTPGLSAMASLERRGMIKRVTPLFRPREQSAPPMSASLGVAASFGTIAMDSAEASVGAGTCMLELEPDADITTLQSALAADPDVDYAARVPVRYMVARRKSSDAGKTPAATPPAASTMWNLARIRLDEARAHNNFKDADAIKVAVLDSGVELDHPDLVGRVSKYVYTYPGLTASSGPQDIIGHGTHVAGTIGANFANAFGVRGVCDSELMIWKIFDDDPDFQRVLFAPDEYVYYVNPIMYRKALADCIEEGVHVINLSIGGEGAPDFVEQSHFNTLLADGVTIVAAMGNERRRGSPTSYPAAIPGVIAVGATNVNDRVASFSNGGSHIAISAPGVGIWSTLPTYPGQFGFDALIRSDGSTVPGAPRIRETDYDAWDGTSMASPHVAAAAGLLLANAGPMSGSEVKAELERSADPVPDMMGAAFHPDYGSGRLNLLELLQPHM